MDKKTATSAGGIVLRCIDSQLRIALARDPNKGPNAWVLPKGHVNSKEDIARAALREIREEIGITSVQLIRYLGTVVRQSVEDSGETVEKTTHFFLAYALGSDDPIAIIDPSLTEMRWFTPQEALGVIPFPQDRKFLEKHLHCMFEV